MLKRYILGLPVSGLATGAVFGLMMGLIATEWTPQEKAQVRKFEVNPVVEDVNLLTDEHLSLPYNPLKLHRRLRP